MKFNELKDKTVVELQQLVAVNREKVRELRFKVANKQLKNVRELRDLKRVNAQALTLLRQRSAAEPASGKVKGEVKSEPTTKQ